MSLTIHQIYERLYDRLGSQHWWPAETPFEVCVGAILTQNTAWSNVEKAIYNLKAASLLEPEAIQMATEEDLARVIRPAGYYNLKSRKLKAFVMWLDSRFEGSLEKMFREAWQVVRRELLQVWGIGPETADSILLYAGAQPSFVVDAYTRRLLYRLGLVEETIAYEPLRHLFMDSLVPDVSLFNEFHALIVEQSKVWCTKQPRCAGCPLATMCPSVR